MSDCLCFGGGSSVAGVLLPGDESASAEVPGPREATSRRGVKSLSPAQRALDNAALRAHVNDWVALSLDGRFYILTQYSVM
jgi:hypothetical protein